MRWSTASGANPNKNCPDATKHNADRAAAWQARASRKPKCHHPESLRPHRATHHASRSGRPSQKTDAADRIASANARGYVQSTTQTHDEIFRLPLATKSRSERRIHRVDKLRSVPSALVWWFEQV